MRATSKPPFAVIHTTARGGGIFAAYAIGDLLARHDDRGLRAYDRFICAEFESYRAARARHYGDERRWPRHTFWQRRLDAATAKAM